MNLLNFKRERERERETDRQTDRQTDKGETMYPLTLHSRKKIVNRFACSNRSHQSGYRQFKKIYPWWCHSRQVRAFLGH